MNRKQCLGLLIAAIALAACTAGGGQPSGSGPFAPLVDYVEQQTRLPRQACLNTLSRSHSELITQVEKEAPQRTDLATNPFGLMEVYQAAARRVGVRQVFPGSTFDTDGQNLRLEAVNWCGGWAAGSTYDLFVVDLSTGDVWHIGQRDIPRAGPEVRWLGDGWAVITYWTAAGGSESHLEIVAQQNGDWISVYRSEQPAAAGATPLVWLSQTPAQFHFNNSTYQDFEVGWQPPGLSPRLAGYVWQDGSYVEVPDNSDQPDDGS